LSGCGGGDEDAGSGSWAAVGDGGDSCVGDDFPDGDEPLDASIEFRSDVSSVGTLNLLFCFIIMLLLLLCYFNYFIFYC
jgi:hypothetical protein